VNQLRRPAAAAIALALLLGGPVSAASAASPTPTPTPGGKASTPTNPLGTDKNVVTFGIQPAGLGKVDQRGYFTYSATPGAHLSDHAAILNYSTKPLTLQVDITDALSTPTGGFALLADGQKPKDVGTWVSYPPKLHTMVVPARTADKPGERDLPLTVVIPANATPGDHVGGITVSLLSLATSPNGSKYKLVQRVGARLFIRVSGALRPELTVENLGASYHGTLNPLGKGHATITYTVHNTGNVALGGTQEVSVSGLFGSTAKAKDLAQIPLLLPGFSINVSVDVAGVVPAFRETATVSLTPLKIEGTDLPPAGPWIASTGFWAIPWPWIGLLCFLLLSLAVFEWRMRHRRRGGDQAPPEAPAAVPTPVGASS
jgi:hypothetical protein